MIRTAAEVLAHFADRDFDEEMRVYLLRHARRLAILVRIVEQHLPPAGGGRRAILVVGPGLEAQLLRDRLDDVAVDSLGFLDHRFPLRPGDVHVEFDLNEAFYPEAWPQARPHDVIVMAEVIEHLYTAPRQVLGCIRTFLRPGGHLILQTPNACCLSRRLGMLVGRNPFHPIRETRQNPGHFREYTRREMRDIAVAAQLELVDERFENYFRKGTAWNAVFNRITPLEPRTLRNGMTMSLRRPLTPVS